MTVYLVGAGPGDPRLLTVRGAEVLAQADVVVHDRLSTAALLDLAPAEAERISVGKVPGKPSVAQDDINALLVDRGRLGLEVVRLKGGDPFVFARGGEEAAALSSAGVPFEIIPGVSSAVAVPAYAGVPVTHRGLSTSFTVVTGHEDPWAATETDWEAVARVGGTIVVLMGVATRAAIAGRLVAGGLPAATPVTAVTWGTRPEQTTVRTTLGSLGDADVEAPAVIVIGAVAGLDLAWWEHLPLFGRRVVVTRPRHQAADMASRLRSLGAEPVVVPAIEVGEPADGGRALRHAAAEVGRFRWVVFTSANAVDRVMPLMPDARALGGVQVAAIGPGTAEALRRYSVVADLVPGQHVGEALAAAFPSPPSEGGAVLLPQAAGARAVVADSLGASGWTVEVVEAYRTGTRVLSHDERESVACADIVTFASSSAVTALVESVGPRGLPPLVACIGPVAAATARAAGLTVDIEAPEHTVPGLVAALADHVRRTGD